jgi:cell fate regulator YaaT (PSP1 superfamily)
MGCSSCASGTDGQPRGCKSNGTCGTDSCNKLTVFDWLANMSLPAGEAPFDCVEVRFKNSRKEFFRNSDTLPLHIGDLVATQASSGHDLGMVTLTGSLVKVQMKKKKVSFSSLDLAKVYRKATEKDVEIWQRCRDREEEIKKRSREIAIALQLQMKLSDVEFQGDGSKATFYYTAEDRVDFRQLIKDMAKAFGIRIEMRQIGYRQEAQRLGGIGSCGRELCCSTWLTDFRSVGTSAARYQQLSLNPQKLAGQCGKLKCCLNYELDVYVDALKDFPAADTKLFTEKGLAFCQKVDIFQQKLWFSYRDEPANWHVLSKEQTNEILKMNKAKEPVQSLEAYAVLEVAIAKEVVFENVVGQDSLTRFDVPKSKSKNSRNKNSKNRTARPQTNNRTEANNKAATQRPERAIRPEGATSHENANPAAAPNNKNKKRRNNDKKPGDPKE